MRRVFGRKESEGKCGKVEVRLRSVGIERERKEIEVKGSVELNVHLKRETEDRFKKKK